MSLADLPLHLGDLGDLPADDLALLRLYAEEGNEQAFAELVSRHAEWIRSACRRSLRDKDLADDATQTVFTILARKASLLPDGTRVSGWLYRTTKFVVSDLRKREMRHRRRYNMAMRAAIERGAEASEADNPANNGIHEFVGHVLAALPEHERQAVAMHFFDGLTFREIGEALGLSRDGAKKRVARALARLRSNFAIRSLALAAATVAAAIMRAGSTAQAVIETGAKIITSPSSILQSLQKVLAAGAAVISSQISSNFAKLTVARALATGAVVTTAVVCGTKLESASSTKLTRGVGATIANSAPQTFALRGTPDANVSIPGVNTNSNVNYAPGRSSLISSQVAATGAPGSTRAPQAIARSLTNSGAGAAGGTRSTIDGYVLPPTVNKPVQDRVNGSPVALMASRGAGRSDATAQATEDGGSRDKSVRHVMDLASPDEAVQQEPAPVETAKSDVRTTPAPRVEPVRGDTVAGGAFQRPQQPSIPAVPPVDPSSQHAGDQHHVVVASDSGLLASTGGSAQSGQGSGTFVALDTTKSEDRRCNNEQNVDHEDKHDNVGHGTLTSTHTSGGHVDSSKKTGESEQASNGGNSGGGGDIRGTLGHHDSNASTGDAEQSHGSSDAGTGSNGSADDASSDVTDKHEDKHHDSIDRIDGRHDGQWDSNGNAVPPDDSSMQQLLGGNNANAQQQPSADSMMQLLGLGDHRDQSDVAASLNIGDVASGQMPDKVKTHLRGGDSDLRIDDGTVADGGGFVGQLVPEPASIGLLAGMTIAGLLRRRR